MAYDRIQEITPVTGVTYIENSGIDFNNGYFSDIIGVSKYVDREPEKIRLWVEKSLFPYIATKPLHDCQKIENETETGYEIGIEVRPNYELEQIILSFGERMKVLYSEKLKSRIKERLTESINNYN